ncbi:hypothetical protein GCM10023155_09740 [Bremerella cremea]
MKDNRFKLTAFLAVALLAAGVAVGAASQSLKQSNREVSRAGGALRSSRLEGDIDLLLQNVVDRWYRTDGITADVNWQVKLFGQSWGGNGQYTQTGVGAMQRHGIILQGTDPVAPIYFQQAILASEPLLWTQWRTKIDESASMVRLNQVVSSEQTMPRAGIAHLMWRMTQCYHFDTVDRVVQGDRQFLLIRGTKQGGETHEACALPFLDRGANGATLLLDAASGFPHRIQWEAVTSKGRETLVNVELVNVRAGVSSNEDLLAPKTIVPDAVDQTESYRMAVLSGAGGHY